MTDGPPLDELEEAPAPSAALAAATALDRILWQVMELLPAEAPIAKLTPEERGQLLDLAADLRRVEDITHTKRMVIENLFRAYAAETNARQVPTADGWLVVEPAAGTYTVDIPALRAELVELMGHGLIAQDEIDQAIKTVVEEKPDNAKLNFLARNRGSEVADAIARHRQFVPGDPFRAKLTRKTRASR